MGTTYSLRDLGISPGQSKHEELEIEAPAYVQAEETYGVAGGALPVRLDVTAMTEGTSFRLRFTAEFVGPCARCLEPASLAVQVDSHIVHDHDTDDEDLRSDHVDDQRNELDVTGWAQEEVGLRFPTRVLCRPDCRGLCGQCGADLNADPDHAHEAPTDSRWDALKGLQLDGGGDSDDG